MQKLTRIKLQLYLKHHKSKHLTLNLGSGDNDISKNFPNTINADLNLTKITNLVLNSQKLPFKSNSLPSIVCLEMLEHVHNPFDVMAEIYRVLKPGGKVILTTRFIYPIHEAPHDYYRFTHYGLKLLFKQYKHVNIEPEYTTQKTFAVLLQRICFQTRARILPKIFIGLLYLINFLILHIPNVFKKQFGDIDQKHLVSYILASGYYVSAIKPKYV